VTVPLLQLEDLSIAYATDAGCVHAVRNVSMTVCSGEVFGLVGESGCGKSTLAYAMLGDLGEGGTCAGGRILFKGSDLLSLPEKELRRLRGSKIAIVHQNPAGALTPTMTIGAQLAEVLRVHAHASDEDARRRCQELLERVHLADARRLMERYPHELSGGQQQRVVIAMALLGESDLLVLDEPTTGLDVTVEAAVLDLLLEIRVTFGLAIVYIAHNLGVIARVCERVGVMYAGELVEVAETADLFRRPRHPYTMSLLRCIPRADRPAERHSLAPIPGRVPSVLSIPPGCSFVDRCEHVRPQCRDGRPELQPVAADSLVRCIRWREIGNGPADVTAPPRLRTPAATPAEPEVLGVNDLRVHYPSRRSKLGARRQMVRAVDGVSLTVRKARILAIVGESGCGKSSLGAAIVGLQQPTSGHLSFDGRDISKPVGRRAPIVRRLLQMIFQDHSATLNPTISIGRIIGRPLRLFSIAPSHGVEAEVRQLLRSVGLDETTMRRKPSQLSGGQRQRVAIARAFAGRPKLVVCDEITSALDVSVQASVLNFLLELQRDNDTSLIFISHDLGVVRYLADDVVVMYLGHVCESGPAEVVFGGPNHPYTEALLSAVPVPDPEAHRDRIRLMGTVPSAVSPPSGCPFHTRCPRKVGKICEEEVPPWRELGGEHRIWCHLPLSRGAIPYAPAQTGTTSIPSISDTEAGATLHA
jgi:peptide/nickel transport system ATP-binding protein